MTTFTCDKCGRQIPEAELFDLKLTPRSTLTCTVNHLRSKLCPRCADIIWGLLLDALRFVWVSKKLRPQADTSRGRAA